MIAYTTEPQISSKVGVLCYVKFPRLCAFCVRGPANLHDFVGSCGCWVAAWLANAEWHQCLNILIVVAIVRYCAYLARCDQFVWLCVPRSVLCMKAVLAVFRNFPLQMARRLTHAHIRSSELVAINHQIVRSHLVMFFFLSRISYIIIINMFFCCTWTFHGEKYVICILQFIIRSVVSLLVPKEPQPSSI